MSDETKQEDVVLIDADTIRFDDEDPRPWMTISHLSRVMYGVSIYEGEGKERSMVELDRDAYLAVIATLGLKAGATIRQELDQVALGCLLDNIHDLVKERLS